MLLNSRTVLLFTGMFYAGASKCLASGIRNNWIIFSWDYVKHVSRNCFGIMIVALQWIFFLIWVEKIPFKLWWTLIREWVWGFSKHTIMVFFITYERWVVNVDIPYTWQYETFSLHNTEKVFKFTWKSDGFYNKYIKNDYPKLQVFLQQEWLVFFPPLHVRSVYPVLCLTCRIIYTLKIIRKSANILFFQTFTFSM